MSGDPIQDILGNVDVAKLAQQVTGSTGGTAGGAIGGDVLGGLLCHGTKA